MKNKIIVFISIGIFSSQCLKFKEHPLDPATPTGFLLSFVQSSYFTPKVYMFAPPGTYTGDLWNAITGSLTVRESVNTICSNEFHNSYPEYSSKISQIIGFISISSADQIIDFPNIFNVPTNQEIIGIYTNVTIANNWNDLVDGSIQNHLSVAIGLNGTWWSGSDPYGITQTDQCNNWTSNSGITYGTFGNQTDTGSTWITNTPSPCSLFKQIICIAW